MSIMNVLDDIVTDWEKSLDDCGLQVDKGTTIRDEVEGYEKEIEVLKGLIEQSKTKALDLGYAEIVIGTPSQLAPTSKMYIELHGQEAFDKVKRIGKAPEKFTWID
tara:strand:+ start:83 stop:400 length:318 start_codon:yes stop_codon:yes gene_type:complete